MSHPATVTVTARRPGRAAALALAALICTVPALVPQPAAAQQANLERSIRFDIPAGALTEALNRLAVQSGIALGGAGELTAGRSSPGLQGEYSIQQALRRLLAGSGLDYRVAADGTVTLVTGAAEAGTGQLSPLVVSATRRETPVSELTRSVTVIGREQVAQQQRIDRSVGEILAQHVPGFSQSTEALTDFGQTLRGRNFLTLIDGVPQSTPLRDGRRSLNTIGADSIERVEVVRGGTAAYGFGATGGLVNIITRRPEDGALNLHSEAGFEISATHPDDSLQWHLNQRVDGRSGEFDYLASGTFVRRNGMFDADGDRIPADPFGVQGGLADTDELNFLGKVGYQWDGNQRLELSASRFEIFQDSEFAGLGSGDASERRKTPAVRGNINVSDPGTQNTLVNARYRHRELLGSDVRSQVFYGDLTTRFSKFPGFPQVEVRSEKIGARFTADTPVQLPAAGFNAIWGVDYLHDETSQPSLDGPDQTPSMEQDAVAGFLQLEVPVAEWGLLRAGVRHEAIWVDVDDVLNRQGVAVRGGTLQFNETLFNASAVVFLSDTAELFGGFSQGFSLADIGRAIADTTATSAEALESEVQKVDNFELGLRGRSRHWDASITGFYSRSDNGTTFDADLVITKQPERIWGLEATASVQPTEHLRLGGTLAWLQGEVDLDDDGDFDEDLPSTRVPPLKLTSYIQYLPFDWWTARLQGLYSGHREPDSTQFGGAEVRDYVVFDLYSGVDTGFGTLELGVGNLFNADYFPVLNQAAALDFAFSQAPGRTVSLTYSVDW